MYYDVQNADQLNNVFSSIAQNLANLRITQVTAARRRTARRRVMVAETLTKAARILRVRLNVYLRNGGLCSVVAAIDCICRSFCDSLYVLFTRSVYVIDPK